MCHTCVSRLLTEDGKKFGEENEMDNIEYLYFECAYNKLYSLLYSKID